MWGLNQQVRLVIDKKNLILLILFFSVTFKDLFAQCEIMEPGFQFLTSSRGCAPFQVRLETRYLFAIPGTTYYVDWGDGSQEEVYTQTGPTGVELIHTYRSSPVDCGYDLTIDASNSCNPRGSVVPINTQVVVWTDDVIDINPDVYRVCEGFAASVRLRDNSDWNCFPRATRENAAPRWIQWIYGTGPAGQRIPGVTVDGVTPGGFPYLDPVATNNPIYPVNAPGEQSLAIAVPAVGPMAGDRFEITLKNWNQCNPYDEDLTDGNPRNPIYGNTIDGDNPPRTTTARIEVVASPDPRFITRLRNANGPEQRVFCIGDAIYFDNETPSIPGADFEYTWEFFDNNTGAGLPIATRNNRNPTFAYHTSGLKLIRLTVRDNNAAGDCEAFVEQVITISPTLLARIQVTDLADNSITPEFCQQSVPPLGHFEVRFRDASIGVPNPATRWRWEFYDNTGALLKSEPSGTTFSDTPLGPFDETYIDPGVYKVKLIIKDGSTSCESADSVMVKVYEQPVPDFSANRVCLGNTTAFLDASTLNALEGETIVSREWDFNYNGTTFIKDAAYDNQTDFTRTYAAADTFDVALRVATEAGCTELVVKSVIVDPAPTADIMPDTTAGCSILEVNFTNLSAQAQPSERVEYTWEIDDGTGFTAVFTQFSDATDFSDVFTYRFRNTTLAPKDFAIRLSAKTLNCEIVGPPVTIKVFPGPGSGFSEINYFPFDENCSPVAVDFVVDPATQSLNPVDYTWKIEVDSLLIDEISTGTTPDFSYQFQNTDQTIKDFKVSLVTTLPSGCFGDSSRIIRVNPVPVADFAMDTLIFDCETVKLNMDAIQKGLLDYHWTVKVDSVEVLKSNTLGDTFDYEIPRPSAGTEDVLLAIALQTTNFAGCISPVTSRAIFIPAKDNINAGFAVSPLVQSMPNSTVQITNTSHPGPWTYLWDFGDGTTSNDPNIASYQYGMPGKFIITLTVKSDFCVEEQKRTIEILPVPPVVDFEYFPASGCPPLTVAFNNLSQYADPESYFWEFGERQGTSRAINPTYTYFEPGLYTVSLSASNLVGDTVREVKEFIIEVFPMPSAQFEVKPRIVNIPDRPVFTKNNSFNATEFLWDFGDGTRYTEFEPTHYYEEVGDYNITLIASTSQGCTDTTTLQGVVRARAGGKVLVPNAFTPSLSGPSGGMPGEGINDVFLPVMEGVAKFEMLVFNRWGELLFRSTDKNIGWDGYHHGRLSPQDVYVYRLNITFQNGEKATRVGDVTLIR